MANCISPLLVWSNKQCFTKYRDALYNMVPCGHCLNCRENYQNEWSVRTFFEVQNAQKNGFVMQFVLTYRESDCPWFHDSEHDFHTRCFNQEHLHKFLKSLYKACTRTRKYTRSGKLRVYYRYIRDRKGNVKRKEVIEPLGFPTMRYLVAEEFGADDNYTHRPHYHILLFFPEPSIYGKDFRDVLNRVRKLWDYGFVFPRKFEQERSLIDKRKFHKYICKYVCKDMDFFNPDALRYMSISDECNAKLKEVSPKHFQSQGFGSSFNPLDNDQLQQFEGVDFENLLKVHLKSDTFTYPLPRYYKNKLFYSYENTGKLNENGNFILIRRLTPLGKQFKRWQFYNLLKKEEDRLQGLFYGCELSKYTSDTDLQNDDHFSQNGIDSVVDLKQFFIERLDGFSLADFCKFRLFYRMRLRKDLDVIFDEDTLEEELCSDILSYDDYPKFTEHYNRVTQETYFMIKHECNKNHKIELEPKSIARLFPHFEEINVLLNYLLKKVGSLNALEREESKIRANNLRNQIYRYQNYV